MDALLDALLVTISSPWIPLIVFAIAALDGLLPPLPSETVVVAAAAVGAATGTPNPWVIGVAAALGAFAGDTLTYALGRAIGTDRFAWMRTARAEAAAGWARRGLERRAASLILIARYIPVGRVAVNLTAGAVSFPIRRFVPLALLAAVVWAAYSVGVGALFGRLFEDDPLVGSAVGVVVAITLGLLVDRVIAWRRGASARAAHTPGPWRRPRISRAAAPRRTGSARSRAS